MTILPLGSIYGSRNENQLKSWNLSKNLPDIYNLGLLQLKKTVPPSKFN